MDKKLRETTNLGVEIVNSKRQVKGDLVTWYKFDYFCFCENDVGSRASTT